MKPKLLLCATFITLTGLSQGEVENKPAAPAAAESEQVSSSIEKEMEDYDASVIAEMKRFQADQDKNKRMVRPSAEPYIDRVLTQIEKEPKGPAAKKGLVWALRISHTKQSRNRIAEIFKKHYSNDPIINEYARSLSRGSSPQIGEALKELSTTTTREDTKLFCTYYLAINLGNQARFSGKLSEDEKKALNKESLKLLKQLNDDPKVAQVSKSLADRVASVIFEKENLSIGRPAPDIVGDDHTGTVFKLSDYRGKVVLLDFWGYW